MSGGLTTIAYTVAMILFIFSLDGLSKLETAERGNNFGIAGMAIALLFTILKTSTSKITLSLTALTIGGAIGIWSAAFINITEIPQLIAVLHSLVGLASTLVGFNNYLYYNKLWMQSILIDIRLTEVFIGIFIGLLTFSGSIAALIKLRGKVILKPLIQLSWKNKASFASILGLSFLLLVMFICTENIILQVLALMIITIIALIFGWHFIASINGADIPVAISMLNSYSGWTATVAGFMLNNDLLIVTGALSGSSGAILSYIMCKAMNRSFVNLIIGDSVADRIICNSNDGEKAYEYNVINTKEASELLKKSRTVIITPGYGMAVAQAQYFVAEITKKLRARGIKVRFGIHPIAGRLPGHMNVLLAEVKIPYELVLNLEEINEDFANTDTVLVIGANDTVNPAAEDDQSSPISGMPVLEVWKARDVIVFKRSMSVGYSGIQNPLFFKENTYMLFGDAKISIKEIMKNL